MRDGSLQALQSRVSNAYACLFSRSAPQLEGQELQVAGVHGHIKEGMEASFEEATKLREDLASTLLAFDGMSEDLRQRCLRFLTSPRGDFFSAELEGREDAGVLLPSLTEEIRPRRSYKEALQGRVVRFGEASRSSLEDLLAHSKP